MESSLRWTLNLPLCLLALQLCPPLPSPALLSPLVRGRRVAGREAASEAGVNRMSFSQNTPEDKLDDVLITGKFDSKTLGIFVRKWLLMPQMRKCVLSRISQC